MPTANKLILTAAILVSLAASLTGLGRAEAATVTVTTIQDEYNTVAQDPAQCSLREAIHTIRIGTDFGGCTHTGNFSTNDEVILRSGQRYVLTIGNSMSADDGGDLDVHQSLIIRSSDTGRATINAGGDSGIRDGVIEVHPTSLSVRVTLNNLEIIGGRNKPAIKINGNSGVIFECIKCYVHGNTSSNENGGALSLYSNSVVSGPTDNGSVYLFESSFFTNRALSSQTGGAVAVYANPGNSTARSLLYAQNTTFAGNFADGHGGGLYVSGPANVNLLNVTLTQNQSTLGEGGGIYLVGDASLTVRNSILSGNLSPAGGDTARDCSKSTTSPIPQINSAGNDGNSIIGMNFGCNPSNQFSTTAGDIINNNPGLNAMSDGYLIPSSSSPALSHGENCQGLDRNYSSITLNLDQRNANRAHAPTTCDIGSIEVSCGNGFVEGSEQCDDGNAIDTDDCTSLCRNPTCGDNFIWDGHEECDLGDTAALDGCSQACMTETLSLTVPSTQVTIPVGTTSANIPISFVRNNFDPTIRVNFGVASSTPAGVNSLDPINFESSGQADATMHVSIVDTAAYNTNYVVTVFATAQNAAGDFSPIVAAPRTFNLKIINACGNGVVESPAEQCDDGNRSNTDACLNTCERAACGDGFVHAGHEQCEPGDLGGNNCRPDCTFEVPGGSGGGGSGGGGVSGQSGASGGTAGASGVSGVSGSGVGGRSGMSGSTATGGSSGGSGTGGRSGMSGSTATGGSSGGSGTGGSSGTGAGTGGASGVAGSGMGGAGTTGGVSGSGTGGTGGGDGSGSESADAGGCGCRLED